MINFCEEKGIGITTQSFYFPLPKNTTISLESIHSKIVSIDWIESSHASETKAVSYVSINFIFGDQKQSFNVFRNGKVVAWYRVSTKAFRHFLDFFYYSLIIDCLEDSK